MIRIGVQFEGFLHGDRLRLEQTLFGQPQPESWARRQLRRWLPPGLRALLPAARGSERRECQRVPVIQDGDLLVRDEPAGGGAPVKINLLLSGGIKKPLRLCSISGSGFAYHALAREAPSPGMLLDLEIGGEGLQLTVHGLVVYAVREDSR